jgi:YD repeat-containing protein
MTLIDGLRSKLSGATVITYTHDPLVGPLTKRDANSNVTTYQYDSYGRLDQVKDHNGRQKEKYQYNFRP